MEKLRKHKLPITQLSAITTDGAASLVGREKGAVV